MEESKKCFNCSRKLKKTALEVEVQEQPKYSTEYRILNPSRLILTTDKKFYDKAVESNGIPIFMITDAKEAAQICLCELCQPVYLIQIPLDK